MTGPELELFGEGAQFEHAGIAVRSIAKAAPGARIIEDRVQKVRIAFASINGLQVELLEPLGEDSPVLGTLTRGQHVYHLCYRVRDLQSAMASARKKGFTVLAQPVPTPAFSGRKIAWLFSPVLGLFELLEAGGGHEVG